MTFHSVTYESRSNQTHSSGATHPRTSRSLNLPALGWSLVNVTSNAINDPLIPFSGFTTPPIASIDFRTITDNAATVSIGRAWSQQIAVLLDGIPLSNNSALITTVTGGGGRVAPDVNLSTGGAVQTALAALTGTTTGLDVSAQVAYLSETYTALTHFCDFESHPPDSDSVGTTRLRELYRILDTAASSHRVGTTGSGAAIIVEQCSFAAIDPSGVVYITSTDIGNAPDQIPASVEDNTPDAFRAHPSVFFPAGKAKYIRGLTRQKVDQNSVSVQQAGNPLKIIRVNAAPTSTDWLVSVDGSEVVLNIPHPAGSDYRRPRDIWASVILPLINTGGANQQFSVYGSPAGTVGGALQSRLQYSDYWRCLPIAGTRIVQNDGGG
jgi:hypothetical protein